MGLHPLCRAVMVFRAMKQAIASATWKTMVMQHFKMFAESLLMLAHRDKFDALLIGCQDESWPEIESQLHSD